MQSLTVRLDKQSVLNFTGELLADVVALNHDESVRRRFAVYRVAQGYIAERIDYPDTIDVRYWGAKCDDTLALYQFFGNEPLANYLYGCMRIAVPGLSVLEAIKNT